MTGNPSNDSWGRGSEWRKWDLHVHSPFSYEWRGEHLGRATTLRHDPAIAAYLDAIEAASVAVVAIVDYWTLDGFIAIREYTRRHSRNVATRIFPGIELRVEAPTNFRLNMQVILDDALSDDRLREFVGRLSIPIPGEKDRPPSEDTFISYARTLDDSKLLLAGFRSADKNDPKKMLDAGQQIARVTLASVEDAVERIGRTHCVVIQPWSTSGGLDDLDWKKHPHEASRLLRFADAMECRGDKHINLCLGIRTDANREFIDTFSEALGPRRVCAPVCGSDAHELSKIGVFPGGRALWMKADPTFAGLRQAFREPTARIYIGDEPAKLAYVRDHANEYLSHVSVKRRAEADPFNKWFDFELPLNAGLVAIIGNKGSGKSALADIIALAANAHCDDMSFLTNDRFCSSRDRYASSFEVTARWESKASRTIGLDTTYDGSRPEECRYLTQHYLEELCNRIDDDRVTSFENELKKIIFSHAPADDRQRFRSLDEAVAFHTEGSRALLETYRMQLRAVNRELVSLEEESSKDARRRCESEIAVRAAAFEAHEHAKPVPVPQPVDRAADDARVATLTILQSELAQHSLDGASTQQRLATARQRVARVGRVEGRLEALRQQVESWKRECAADLADLGVQANEVVAVTIDGARLQLLRAEAEATAAEAEGRLRSDGPLALRMAEVAASIESLQSDLSAPERQYQEYLSRHSEWERRRTSLLGAVANRDSLLGLREALRRIDEVVPSIIEAKRKERLELVERIFMSIEAIRSINERMYEPVQSFASQHTIARTALEMRFEVELQSHRFSERFLAHINQGRKGAFQGVEEGRARLATLLGASSFESFDGVKSFVTSIEDDLRHADANSSTDVATQLRRDSTVAMLFDFVFSLEWLEVRYGLRMRDKEIGMLSPGERGALLLIFYLLLDRSGYPIVIDQPEQNLDNESVYKVLVPCIREVRERRQVFLVTHNPNLAVVCDADQIIGATLSRLPGPTISYEAGAIENPSVNGRLVDVLEGTWPAFENRRDKYLRTT